MASLYELTDRWAALVDAYDLAEDDAQRADALDAIAQTEASIEDKAEAYARIMRNKKAEAEALDVEIKRLEAKKRSAKAAEERMKAAMLDALRMTGKAEIVTTIGKWRRQMNPWRAEVIDADAVPQEWHIPQPDKIDQRGLLDYFKETGEILPGVEFKQVEGVRFR